MRRTPAKTKYVPPIDTDPPFAVIYGTHGIIIGYCETAEDAQRQADALNHQAPQYNHRVKELA